jgi:glutathione S-transferase
MLLLIASVMLCRSWLWGHGFLRYSHDEIEERTRRHLDTLVALLPDKGFVFGSEPTVADCIVFSCIHNLIRFPLPQSGLSEYIRGCPKLVAYERRMHSLVSAAD